MYCTGVCNVLQTKYTMYIIIMLGSKASPTTAPKPRRHKSSTSSDIFDDKESSGLFSSSQPQEGTAGSPARKRYVPLALATSLHILYTNT